MQIIPVGIQVVLFLSKSIESTNFTKIGDNIVQENFSILPYIFCQLKIHRRRQLVLPKPSTISLQT